MRNLPGFPSFSGNFLRRTADQCLFSGVLANSDSLSLMHRVFCHLGLTFYYLRKRRRVMVLLRRVLEPEYDASQLAVEESKVDEPELGNPRLDKPVLDKPEIPVLVLEVLILIVSVLILIKPWWSEIIVRTIP
nr:hypothetical protein [Tanacetum cinerariifolium]